MEKQRIWSWLISSIGKCEIKRECCPVIKDPAHPLTCPQYYEVVLAMQSLEGDVVVWGSYFHYRVYKIGFNSSHSVSAWDPDVFDSHRVEDDLCYYCLHLLRIWLKFGISISSYPQSLACVFRGFTDSQKSVYGLKLRNTDSRGWHEETFKTKDCTK